MKLIITKITSVAALALLMAGSAMAQSNIQTSEVPLKAKKEILLGITGGYTSASGNFTKTDYLDNKSGFATSGINLGLTGTYMLGKHWGVTALASYHAYGNSGLQNLAAGYKEDFDIDSSTVYRKGSNYTLNFLIGPYYSIPVCTHFSIDLRALAGLTNAHIAGNKVDVEDNEASTFEQKAATANTIGMQLGAAARYDISRHFGVLLNVDYYYSKPDFTVENINRVNKAGRLLTQYNEPITGVNANVSLIYKLARK